MTSRLARIAPGLTKLLSYRFAEDFRHDLLAGLSVAAVALPVAVAYAQLAGFEPAVGLYSSILPLVAYALFGTLGSNLQASHPPGQKLGLKWDAREDKLKIAGSFMRVFRLQTRLLDHFPAIIYVSRVGEILRVELPDEIVLGNDALLNL